MSWLNSPLGVIPQHRVKVRTDWDISKARFCVCVFSNSVLDLLGYSHDASASQGCHDVFNSSFTAAKCQDLNVSEQVLTFIMLHSWNVTWDRCAVFFIYLFLFSCKHSVMYFYILSLSLSVFVCLNRFLSKFIQCFP